ncbi:rhamnulokinase, partial [candidate division KSB1 bacterium]|nr:rhamnulokinase [candidate division KSB1 bacterium]
MKYLAFDYGAESGRAMLGTLSTKGIDLQEIHRFQNRQIRLFDSLHWDFLYLFDEMKKGLNKAALNGHTDIAGIGVDTWGVDFGLLDKQGHLLGSPYAYRDSRTNGMIEKAFHYLTKREFYQLTGIQFLQFNSVFQLLSMVESADKMLDIADRLLFMPDLFNYFLTGEKVSEYSIASTSQLLNAASRKWEPAVFDKLNLPLQIMPEIVPPGTILGKMLPQVAAETGVHPIDVIAPACHDTASAVAAVPALTNHWAYLSSGTWSLLGVET